MEFNDIFINYKDEYTNLYNKGYYKTYQDIGFESHFWYYDALHSERGSGQGGAFRVYNWDFSFINTAYSTIDGNHNDTVEGAPFTLTLPATPSKYDTLYFLDIGGALSTKNVTLNNNGNPIMGKIEPLILDIDGISIQLIYVDNIIGWKIIPNALAPIFTSFWYAMGYPL